MRKKNKVKRKVIVIISILILLAGIIGGLYVGGWLMFIKPIMACCAMFDAGTLTALAVGKTILCCIFASAVGGTIFYLGLLISRILVEVA